MAQVGGGGLQAQPFTGSGMQVDPTGQVPLHCGAAVELQGMGAWIQSHAPVAALDLQTMFVGHTPPHRGAGDCWQGIGLSWQPHSVEPGT